jgi:predicted PurR-regulated permease PerM
MDTENAFPGIDFEFVNQEITKFGETLLSSEQIQKMVSNILPVLLTTSISLVGAIVDFFIALIVSLYLLIDMDGLIYNIHHLLRAFCREETCQKILDVAKDCADIFNRYVTGKMIDSLVIGVLCFFLMNILGLPYSIIISLVVGITNMIPYFGPYVGCLPGALILLMISPVKTLIYLVMILVLQQFDGLILGPKILGDSTGLRPFWIIFAVSVGGSVGGVLGMFLGVPVVAIIGYLVSKWIDYRIARNALKEKQEILEMCEETQTEDTATSPSEE